MRWADWLENLPKVVVLIHTPVIIDGNSAYFNSTRRRRRRLYININASIISFSLWPTPIHSSFLVSFCFQFSNDTILVPECRDFLDRLIYERETASLAPTHEKKGSLDLNVRLDVVDRCAYINYFARCLEKRKEQKNNEKSNNFTLKCFSLIFVFFLSFTSPVLFFRLLLQLSQSNLRCNKSLLWKGQAYILFCLVLKGGHVQHEEWLGVYVEIPLFSDVFKRAVFLAIIRKSLGRTNFTGCDVQTGLLVSGGMVAEERPVDIGGRSLIGIRFGALYETGVLITGKTESLNTSRFSIYVSLFRIFRYWRDFNRC